MREALARLEQRLIELERRLSGLESERTWLVRIVLGSVTAAVLALVLVRG